MGKQRLRMLSAIALTILELCTQAAPAAALVRSTSLHLLPAKDICVTTVPVAGSPSPHGIDDVASQAFVRTLGDRLKVNVRSDLHAVQPRTTALSLLALPECQPRAGAIAVRVTIRIDRAQDRYVIDVSAQARNRTYVDRLQRDKASHWQADKVRIVDPLAPGADLWPVRVRNAVTIDAVAMAEKLGKTISIHN